jgi:chemotaxis protein histidine kinase CheA
MAATQGETTLGGLKGEMEKFISHMMKMKVSQLQKRAQSKGISEDAIQAAIGENEDDTKCVLISLMLKSACMKDAAVVCQVPSPARAGSQAQEASMDFQTCTVCVGCIRPPGHDGTCMDGQCNDIFPPSGDSAAGNAPMVVVAEELALQKASNDEIRRKVEETARRKEEAARKAKEEAIRKVSEAMAIAAEEALRKAAEEELALQKAEEARRKAAEEEARRLNAAEEEAAAEALKEIEDARSRRKAKEDAEMARMDDQLMDTFLECVKDRSSRERVRTPLKGTNLYTKHMRACRAMGTSIKVQESSFRSLGNYLKFLEEEGLLRLQPGLTDPVVTEIRRDACREYKYVPRASMEATPTALWQ